MPGLILLVQLFQFYLVMKISHVTIVITNLHHDKEYMKHQCSIYEMFLCVYVAVNIFCRY